MKNPTTVGFQPFAAWHFFGADDTDEVTREYQRVADQWADSGWMQQPDLTHNVTVIGADSSGTVYFIDRDTGEVRKRDAWQVRKVPWL